MNRTREKLLASTEELNDELSTLLNDVATLKLAIDKLSEESNNLRARMAEVSRELSLLNDKLEDLHSLVVEKSYAIKTYAKALSKIEGKLGSVENHAN